MRTRFIHRSCFVLSLALVVGLGAVVLPQPAVADPAQTEGSAAFEAAEKKRSRRARARRPKKPAHQRLGPREHYVYEHKIRRGDTVGKIARRYGVTQEQVLSWNDLVSPHLIRVGRSLTIYSKKRVAQRGRDFYRVKRGDTLGKIAKRHAMKIRELRSVNGLRSDLIRPGQRLIVLVDKPPEVTRLGRRGRRVGTRGDLTGGVQLRSAKGFHVKNPRESWGTPATVRQIKEAFQAMLRRFKRSTICVGDISTREGGPLDGHRSHQRGLDVDIGFYRKGVARDRRFYRVTKRTMDARRTWHLLHAFFRQGQVDMIFIDYALQEPLYKEAQRAGVPKRQLDSWFQYPRRRSAGRGLIRHEPGHANHMHIRFLDVRRSATRGHRSGAAK